jgi:hypothetical protein
VAWWRDIYARHHVLWIAVFLAVAIALAVAAQRLFDENRAAGRWDDWRLPALIAFDALVLFGWVTSGESLERATHRPPPPVAWDSHLPLFIAGVLLAIASSLWFTGNALRWAGVLLLLGGVGLALAALYVSTAARDMGPPRSWLRGGVSWEWLLVLGLTGLGAVLRLYRLDAIPGELTLDQISKFWDIRDVLAGNKAPIFFEANQGREGLFFYLVALTSQFVDLSHMSMKLTSAWIGVAAVPALFLLGKEMAGRRVGLLAAFLLAINKWHILVSRLGYRVALVPLLVILAMFYLVRGLRRGHLVDYGLAGVMLGLGMYSYKSFPFAIPAAISCIGLYALRQGRRVLMGGLIMLLLASLVFIPMGVYALESWEAYVYREKLQVELLEANYAKHGITPLQGYLINLRKTMLMHNFVGDPIEIYNPPHERFLGPVSATLLILGLGYSLARLRSGYSALPLVFALWLMQPVALSMFAPYEQPNALRAVANVGPVLFVAALSVPVLQGAVARVVRDRWRPLDLVVSRADVAEEGPGGGPLRRFVLKPAAVVTALVAIACVPLLIVELRANYESVFVRYPEHQRFRGHPLGRRIAREVQAWLDTAPVFVKYSYSGIDVGLVKVYLTSWGIGETWQPDNPHALGGYQVHALALDQPPLSQQDLTRAVFIIYPEDVDQDVATLGARFPEHIVINRYHSYGELAYAVFVGHE